jgi:hypothetical protein
MFFAWGVAKYHRVRLEYLNLVSIRCNAGVISAARPIQHHYHCSYLNKIAHFGGFFACMTGILTKMLRGRSLFLLEEPEFKIRDCNQLQKMREYPHCVDCLIAGCMLCIP